ncbi:MAG: ribonuclease HII [uncultured bacterium]|nr:MAG: ribonuclease HII [uncultured bacterium]
MPKPIIEPNLFPLQPQPNNHWESCFWDAGCQSIAGLDEAGRGALAGPVVAAAVIFKPYSHYPQIDDSKKLKASERERLFDFIIHEALSYGIGIVSSDIIDEINILQASLLAMKQAVEKMPLKPDQLLIDGNQGVKINISQKTIIKGDSLSMSIGAGSILAKVTRDRLMCDYEKKFPQFKFSVHKGYGTKRHQQELTQNGVLPIHRKTFAPVATVGQMVFVKSDND